MNQLVTGIHHITAIAGDPQKNLEFYAGILGLRLVKKTVNFDAPDVYHFYFGNEKGDPGTILTFFPYSDDIRKGRHGNGMVNTTTFSVPLSSIGYWEERFKRFQVPYKQVQERFENEGAMYFEDPDGLGLELIFNDRDTRSSYAGGPVTGEHAIKGFYSAEIWEESYERTASLLTGQLDHKLIAEKGNRFRYAASDKPGNYIDILFGTDVQRGLGGRGTVHHIAFATPDSQTQVEARKKIAERFLNPTPVLDRSYFTSIYFREPGGVLFEIATEGPGFLIDEDINDLGKDLKLPGQYEQFRNQIENNLAVVNFNIDEYR